MTRTPDLPDGEVLCAPAIEMHEKGTILLGSSVEYNTNVILASKRAIDNVLAKTIPIDPEPMGDWNFDIMDNIEEQFVTATNADLGLQMRILDRGGAGASFKFPMAWALRTYRSYLRKEGVSREDHRDADIILSLFWDAYGSWRLHPRFATLASHLATPDMFFHAVLTMTIAKYLYRHGNSIGLSLEDKHGEPNPDLYYRVGAKERLHIEVKAPPAFQIRRDLNAAVRPIQVTLANTVKKSSPQISRKRPGMLVVGISDPDPSIAGAIDRHREAIARSKGRDHRGMAALITMRPTTPGIGFEIGVTQNPRYEGTARIRTD